MATTSSHRYCPAAYGGGERPACTRQISSPRTISHSHPPRAPGRPVPRSDYRFCSFRPSPDGAISFAADLSLQFFGFLNRGYLLVLLCPRAVAYSSIRSFLPSLFVLPPSWLLSLLPPPPCEYLPFPLLHYARDARLSGRRCPPPPLPSQPQF